MFALAKLYFICPLSAVVKTDHGTVCAKFRDGSYYDVDIVTTHESFDVLEELKESLCSHAPRIVLSRCDVNSPIENEQKELEIDTFPRIPKQEVFEEEFCIKEEPPLHFPNLDTFLEDDSVNEEASEGNLFGGCPSLNILAEQEVVVNDVFFQNACREVLHDHSYSVKSGENEEIPSKISSLNECLHKFEILDEEQESIKDAQNVSDRFPVYTLPNNSQVDMDCHFNFPDSSVSDKFSVDGAIPDLSNIKQEEIVVNCDFFESSNEFILPKYGSEADLHCSFLEPQEGPIVNVQCSNELTSGTETAEGDQEVENIMVSSGKRTKQYFCVYCKKLYTALPRHLERLHRSEEAVKQFCDLPKDAKITEAMNTRSKRTLALDTSGDRNLLDLPKHRSSKAAITGEQTNVFINVKLKQETQADKNHHQEKHADDREHIGHDPRFDQGGSSNLFQSSKSKCTIDSSDCEPDDQVKEDPLTPILNHDELNCNIAKNSSLVLASISKKYSGPTIEGSEQRRTILRELLRRSNFIYNTNGNYNKGDLLVVRRPPKGTPYRAADYASCPVCRAFYSKRSVRKHIKRCRAKARESANDSPDEQLSGCACSVLQKDIFPLLTDTELVKVIQSDSLIVAYGNHLCEEYNNPEQYGFIRLSLQYIARLLCAIKTTNPCIKDLASIFAPSHVKIVEKAIETMAEMEDHGPWRYHYNGVHDLRRVCMEAAEVWKRECLKCNDETRLKQANYFLRLFNEENEFLPEEGTRRKWSTSTKARFFKMFKAHLESKRLPSNTQCRMAMQKLPSLQSKTVAAVKTAIFNEIRRREKDCERKIGTSTSVSTHNV